MRGDVGMQIRDGHLLQGKINPVMYPPAFLPRRGAAGNQGREIQEVLCFERRAACASLHCRRQGVQSPDGFAEIWAVADGPYVLPHDAAHFAGQCRLIDGSRSTVRVTRIEGDDLRTGSGSRSLKTWASFDHGASGWATVNETFQQGVAGHAVGPMKTVGSNLT